MFWRTTFLVLILAVVAIPFQTAQAHASLVEASPAPGERLSATPNSVRLTFSEPIVVKELVLLHDNQRIELPFRQIDPQIIEADIERPLKNGTYQVMWTVISLDGDPITDIYEFYYPSWVERSPIIPGAAATLLGTIILGTGFCFRGPLSGFLATLRKMPRGVSYEEPQITKSSIYLMISLIAVVFLVCGVIPTAVMYSLPHPMATVFPEPRLVPDYALTRLDGEPFQFSDYRGKAVVVFFGYTSCPDVCPTTLYDLAQAQALLEDRVSEVEFIFISIDPENDTPERIQTYLAAFDGSFIGAYAPQQSLQPVLERFYADVFPATEGRSTIGHTSSTFVIDPEGYLKLRLHYNSQPRYIVQDILYILNGRL